MTLRNFPPADQCTPEDLDAIADLVVSEPNASWDLAGSREHIEALCRRNQALAQERDAARWADETRAKACEAALAQRDAARATAAALERDLARVTNHLDEAQQEIAYLKARSEHQDARRAALGDLAFDLLADLDSAATRIQSLASTLDAERNARQAEVLQAEADRERADEAEARAEQLRHQVESMALLLDQQQATHAANDRIRSAFAGAVPAICGVTVEELDHRLDAELAAHPDVGPLHHARDQRDQEDTTP